MSGKFLHILIIVSIVYRASTKEFVLAAPAYWLPPRMLTSDQRSDQIIGHGSDQITFLR